MNVDGSNQTNVTNDAGYDFEPDWSPDGSRIAWRSNRAGDISDVWAMESNGTNLINLTMDPGYEREPAWAPDDTKIAYASVQGSNFDIWVMETNGTGKLPLTTGPGNDYDPDWQSGSGSPTSFALTVTRTGRGKVISSPSGIRCGNDCSEMYLAGTVVTLTATSAPGWVFEGWSGGCAGNGPCIITMNNPQMVAASFSRAGTIARAGEEAEPNAPEKLNPGEELEQNGTPEAAMLFENYPNPFNPSTTIRYSLNEDMHVTLNVYNTLGQLVATLVDQDQPAGYREVVWNGTNDSDQKVASGIYIYRMRAQHTGGVQAADFVETRRMMLLK